MTKEQDLAALKRYYIAEYFDGEDEVRMRNDYRRTTGTV